MTKKILNLLKKSKLFYIGMIAIIYFAIKTGINEANKNAIMKYGIENNSRVEIFFPNTTIGIKYGILVFFILTILWIFILILVDNMNLVDNFNKDKVFLKGFFVLGQMTVENIITKLFYIGLVAVAFWAYMFGRYFFSPIILRFITYNKWVNLIIPYIITFAIGLILWKIVCELLIVIFRCFEIYYKSKKREIEK